MRKLLLASLVVTVIVSPCLATDDDVDEIEILGEIEDVTEAWYLNPTAYPAADRAINVFTGRSLRRNSLLLVFDHRVRQALADEPLHDLLGFDAGGLKIGLGLRYGLRDNLDIGLYRLNGTVEPYDTYEFDARYQILGQANHGMDLAVRAGVSWFVQKNDEDDSGFLGQLLLSRAFAHRLNIGTGLLLHTNSSSPDKFAKDEDHSVAVPGYLEFRLSRSLALTVEGVASLSGYRSSHPVISSGFKILTNRHTFVILVSNSQYIAADGIVTNTGTDMSDAAIGFTVLRELNL